MLCHACDRHSPLTVTRCAHCGADLTFAGRERGRAHQLILRELEEWKRSGKCLPETEAELRRFLSDRFRPPKPLLTPPRPPEKEAPAVPSASSPPGVPFAEAVDEELSPIPSVPAAAASAVERPRTRSEPAVAKAADLRPGFWEGIGALLTDRNIRWLLNLAIFLVSVGISAYVYSRWDRWSPALQCGVLGGLTLAAFGAGALFRHGTLLRATGTSLIILAAIMAPIDVATAIHLDILRTSHPWGADAVTLLACAGGYLLLARGLKEEVLSWLAAIAVLPAAACLRVEFKIPLEAVPAHAVLGAILYTVVARALRARFGDAPDQPAPGFLRAVRILGGGVGIIGTLGLLLGMALGKLTPTAPSGVLILGWSAASIFGALFAFWERMPVALFGSLVAQAFLLWAGLEAAGISFWRQCPAFAFAGTVYGLFGLRLAKAEKSNAQYPFAGMSFPLRTSGAVWTAAAVLATCLGTSFAGFDLFGRMSFVGLPPSASAPGQAPILPMTVSDWRFLATLSLLWPALGLAVAVGRGAVGHARSALCVALALLWGLNAPLILGWTEGRPLWMPYPLLHPDLVGVWSGISWPALIRQIGPPPIERVVDAATAWRLMPAFAVLAWIGVQRRRGAAPEAIGSLRSISIALAIPAGALLLLESSVYLRVGSEAAWIGAGGCLALTLYAACLLDRRERMSENGASLLLGLTSGAVLYGLFALQERHPQLLLFGLSVWVFTGAVYFLRVSEPVIRGWSRVLLALMLLDLFLIAWSYLVASVPASPDLRLSAVALLTAAGGVSAVLLGRMASAVTWPEESISAISLIVAFWAGGGKLALSPEMHLMGMAGAPVLLYFAAKGGDRLAGRPFVRVGHIMALLSGLCLACLSGAGAVVYPLFGGSGVIGASATYSALLLAYGLLEGPFGPRVRCAVFGAGGVLASIAWGAFLQAHSTGQPWGIMAFWAIVPALFGITRLLHRFEKPLHATVLGWIGMANAVAALMGSFDGPPSVRVVMLLADSVFAGWAAYRLESRFLSVVSTLAFSGAYFSLLQQLGVSSGSYILWLIGMTFAQVVAGSTLSAPEKRARNPVFLIGMIASVLLLSAQMGRNPFASREIDTAIWCTTLTAFLYAAAAWLQGKPLFGWMSAASFLATWYLFISVKLQWKVWEPYTLPIAFLAMAIGEFRRRRAAAESRTSVWGIETAAAVLLLAPSWLQALDPDEGIHAAACIGIGVLTVLYAMMRRRRVFLLAGTAAILLQVMVKIVHLIRNLDLGWGAWLVAGGLLIGAMAAGFEFIRNKAARARAEEFWGRLRSRFEGWE